MPDPEYYASELVDTNQAITTRINQFRILFSRWIQNDQEFIEILRQNGEATGEQINCWMSSKVSMGEEFSEWINLMYGDYQRFSKLIDDILGLDGRK